LSSEKRLSTGNEAGEKFGVLEPDGGSHEGGESICHY
jgi:hypothetical protein